VGFDTLSQRWQLRARGKKKAGQGTS
jgi:hypothetical protein